MARERFDCACSCEAEYLAIWVDDDLYDGIPAAYQNLEVTIGTPAMTWMWDRIKEAWNIIRGRRSIYGSVLLDADDAIRLRAFLDDYIHAATTED